LGDDPRVEPVPNTRIAEMLGAADRVVVY